MHIASAQLSGVDRSRTPRLIAGGSVAAGTVVYNINNLHEKKVQQLHVSVLVGTQKDLDEYNGIRSPSRVDTRPLLVDKSHIEVYVGQETALAITGGVAGYRIEKGTGDLVGFGNVKGLEVIGGSVRLLGLAPGKSSFVVRDLFGRKKTITVSVLERTLLVTPIGRISVGGENARWKTKAVTATSLATTSYDYNSKRTIRGGNQEGMSTLQHRIINYAEGVEQVLTYNLRVGRTFALEPLTTSFEETTLSVGQVVVLQISGGTPIYSLKKSSNAVGFASYKGAGKMSIASTDASGSPNSSVLFEDSGEEDTGGVVYTDDETNEPGVDLSEILHNTSITEEEIAIANSQETFKMYVLGLAPGVSTITITDHEGVQKKVTITVKETVLKGPLNTEKGWYYQDQYRMFEVRGIRTDHPAVVPTYYKSKTYIYKMLKDGITKLTLSIWNPFESKNQEMVYTIRSGTPSTMHLMSNSGAVSVGESVVVTIAGGGGPYTLTKNNELVGLGYLESDMTTIASVAEEQKIILPDGKQLAQDLSGGLLSGEVSVDFTTGWSSAEWESFDALSAYSDAISIASTVTGNNKQAFRVVGLSPGETTITVQDVYGEKKNITLQVLPKQFSFTSVYVGGHFYAPYNPKHLIPFLYEKIPSAAVHQRFTVTNFTASAPNVVGRFQKGKYRQYYLYGIADGSTEFQLGIYNPHERKNQIMRFSATTTGLSLPNLQKLLAYYEIENKSQGPASSINPGGGGFPSGGGGGSTNSSIKSVEISKDNIEVGDEFVLQIETTAKKIVLDLPDGIVFVPETFVQADFSQCDAEVWQNGIVKTMKVFCKDGKVDIKFVSLKEGDSLIGVGNIAEVGQKKQIKIRSGYRLLRLPIGLPYKFSYNSSLYVETKIEDQSIASVSNLNGVISFLTKKEGFTIRSFSVLNPITEQKVEMKINLYVVQPGQVEPDKTEDFYLKLLIAGSEMENYRRNEKSIQGNGSYLDYLGEVGKKYLYFYEKVKPGSVWDYKNYNGNGGYKGIKNLYIQGNKYSVDVPGNFAFGYSAMAGGIPYIVQFNASYGAQIYVDLSSSLSSSDNFNLLKTALTEYHDNERTARGALLYKKHGLNIDAQKISSYLTRNMNDIIKENGISNYVELFYFNAY